jgi:hypothetical protein
VAAVVHHPEEAAKAPDSVADLDCLGRKDVLLAHPDARLVATVQKSYSSFPFKEKWRRRRRHNNHSLPAAFSRVASLASPPFEASLSVPAAVDSF